MGKRKPETWVLEKTELTALLGAVARQGPPGPVACYAPTAGPEGTRLARIEAGTGIDFESVNTRLPPKSLFLPQREVLCAFRGDTLEDIPSTAAGEGRILFGVRPCDARALAFLDRVFSDEHSRYGDPYYLGRRESALVISLACRAPGRACFCTSVGGSPAGTEGADIGAVDLGKELLLTPVTKRGQAFLDQHRALLAAADAAAGRAARQQAEQAGAGLPVIDLAGLKETLDGGFDDPVWEAVARSCLGCGACAYVCPTCHCFDISDEIDSRGRGRRLRTWDCCQYPLFTRHASGHNPRGSRKQRLRQRIMHKYSYAPENLGAVFCVGCGRCSLSCPAHLDIRETLRALQGAGCPL
jgi:sulfhydrogenase subunit beta (sulfur reductase)